MKATEANLVKRVKIENDSEALEILVRRYRPMVDNLFQQYHINGYDRDDWYQEAFIICHQTCLLYNGDSGSKFGSFFKMRFKNHIIDIIRKENTFKRQANQIAGSLDMELIDKTPEEFVSDHQIKMSDIMNDIDKCIDSLSRLEAIALLFLLGELSLELACLYGRCDSKRILRAVDRCKIKFRNYISNLS